MRQGCRGAVVPSTLLLLPHAAAHRAGDGNEAKVEACGRLKQLCSVLQGQREQQRKSARGSCGDVWVPRLVPLFRSWRRSALGAGSSLSLARRTQTVWLRGMEAWGRHPSHSKAAKTTITATSDTSQQHAWHGIRSRIHIVGSTLWRSRRYVTGGGSGQPRRLSGFVCCLRSRW